MCHLCAIDGTVNRYGLYLQITFNLWGRNEIKYMLSKQCLRQSVYWEEFYPRSVQHSMIKFCSVSLVHKVSTIRIEDDFGLIIPRSLRDQA